MDRFEDGLHRGFGHEDDLTSDDMAAIAEIAAMAAADSDDDTDPAQRGRSGLPTSMRAKRANQRGRQF